MVEDNVLKELLKDLGNAKDLKGQIEEAKEQLKELKKSLKDVESNVEEKYGALTEKVSGNKDGKLQFVLTIEDFTA